MSVLPKHYPKDNQNQLKADQKEPILYYLDKKKPVAQNPFLSRLPTIDKKASTKAP